MYKLLLLTFLFISTSLFGQETYSDTLFYSEGLIRACTIVMDTEKELRINYSNKKGQPKLNRLVLKKDLDQYYYKGEMIILKGNNATTTLNESKRTDTVVIYPSQISVNPFSPALGGLNLVYSQRFGESLDHGISFPFRILTLWGNTALFSTGMHYDFYAVNNRSSNFILGAGIAVAGLEGEIIAGAIFKLGGTRKLREKLNLSYYFGVGPSTSTVIIDAHIGIGFTFGNPKIVDFY